MGKVSSLFVRKVIDVADNSVDKSALLCSVGIELGSPIDPSHMVTDTDYYSFLEMVAVLDGNGTTIPLRAGAAMNCDDYAAFGLAWKSAATLRGSYERAERYGRVLGSVTTFEIENTDSGAFMHLHRESERRLGVRLANEETIASITSMSRQISIEEFKPIGVFFKHSAPKSKVDHEAYFRCPVQFESDRDALLVSNETLQTPNKLADGGISRFFDTHLEAEIFKLKDDFSLDRLIRIHVSKSLSEGVPSISAVAKHFGMSGRTLQRRLSDQGYSYQTMVDELRRQLAGRLLKQTNYSLAEVAFMTGFSEQSAFNRAFKRWEAQTPRSFRIGSQPRHD